MLTKWKIFNFKAIQQETELEFKPLTIFAGANSSGKSTVLQSILLVAQTLSSRVTQRPVVLNGDLVKLGEFKDVKSQDSEANEITVGWELQAIEPLTGDFRRRSSLPALRYFYNHEDMVRSTGCEISFDVTSGGAPPEVMQLQPGLKTLSLQALIRTSDGSLRPISIGLSPRAQEEVTIDGEATEALPRFQRFDVQTLDVTYDDETEERQQLRWLPHENEGVHLKHFLPLHTIGKFDTVHVNIESIMRALSGDPKFYSSRSSFPHLGESVLEPPLLKLIRENLTDDHPLTQWIEDQIFEDKPIKLQEIEGYNRRTRLSQRARIKPVKNEDTLRLELGAILSTETDGAVFRQMVRLPDDVDAACQYTRSWFSNQVKYLGPLRDEPKALYPLVSNVDPNDVGLKGEHTAAVFHIHREQVVDYLSPENFKLPRILPKRSRRSLNFAVSEWLEYLGVATSLRTEDRGKTGHEMQVCLHKGDQPHDLTHVGVGVSQVLPIVVSCLLAEPDSMLIFEQPELHLHPMVQERLADFFLAMSMLGKQCVLETHSEYLINRLRFRSAAAEGSQLVETIQIYFAEKKGSQSIFRSIEVNEFGAILDWPDGFFDQSQSESEKIIREATRKRKQQQKEAGNG